MNINEFKEYCEGNDELHLFNILVINDPKILEKDYLIDSALVNDSWCFIIDNETPLNELNDISSLLMKFKSVIFINASLYLVGRVCAMTGYNEGYGDGWYPALFTTINGELIKI